MGASGELEKTLIVVVSDNGASGEGGPSGTFNEWEFFNGVPSTTERTLPHIDELGTPFKRYALGSVFRGERPAKGRLREFAQRDFDTIGTESARADG